MIILLQSTEDTPLIARHTAVHMTSIFTQDYIPYVIFHKMFIWENQVNIYIFSVSPITRN